MKPSDARPPAWAEATLRLLLRPEDREGVTGDLLEQYQDRLAAGRGRRRAVAWYVRQVAGFAWRSCRRLSSPLWGRWQARAATRCDHTWRSSAASRRS
jgi:hypothetical protein